MPNLNEVSQFDPVIRLETSTLVLGGPGGPSNAPLQQLTNRTKFLKDFKDAVENKTDAAKGAMMVGYKGFAATALSYTVFDKLRVLLDVMSDFNAKNDGSTDDTAAFVAGAASGRPVLVPAGTYVLTSNISTGNFIFLGTVNFVGGGSVVGYLRITDNLLNALNIMVRDTLEVLGNALVPTRNFNDNTNHAATTSHVKSYARRSLYPRMIFMSS